MSSRTNLARALLAVVTVAGAGVGAWARFSPHAFYADFPIGGWEWVSRLGPYNAHLLADFGNGLLALAAVSAVAACKPSRTTVGTAFLAWEIDGALHLLWHLPHLDMFSPGQRLLMLVVLLMPMVLPAIAVWLVWRTPPRTT